MDTENFLSFISYRYGEIKWNNYRQAVMGIQSSSHFYYNYVDNVYQLDRVQGHGTSNIHNTDLNKVQCYRISNVGLRNIDFDKVQGDGTSNIYNIDFDKVQCYGTCYMYTKLT